MANCKYCDKPIPKIRLEAIPGIETCLECSDEPETLGANIYAHKTAGEVGWIRGGSKDQIRNFKREVRRAR